MNQLLCLHTLFKNRVNTSLASYSYSYSYSYRYSYS